MKKLILFVLLSSTCFISAQENQPLPDENKPEKEVKVVPMAQNKELQRSIIIIDVKEKAQDYVKAFELLKKDKPSSRIYYQLYSNKTINNIIDINMLDNGTLILFKIATTQGTKFIIVPTEDIEEIGHL